MPAKVVANLSFVYSAIGIRGRPSHRYHAQKGRRFTTFRGQCVLYIPPHNRTHCQRRDSSLPPPPPLHCPIPRPLPSQVTQFLRILLGGPLRGPEIWALQRGVGFQPRFDLFVQVGHDLVVLVVVLVVADSAAVPDAKVEGRRKCAAEDTGRALLPFFA